MQTSKLLSIKLAFYSVTADKAALLGLVLMSMNPFTTNLWRDASNTPRILRLEILWILLPLREQLSTRNSLIEFFTTLGRE